MSDTAMNILLHFISGFLALLIATFSIKKLKDFADQLPLSVVIAKKLIGNDKDKFTKFASCPKCDSIYPLNMCTILSRDGSKLSKQCSYVEFPHHPHSSKRATCNFQIMKTIRTSAGTTTLHARRTFCYASLIEYF